MVNRLGPPPACPLTSLPLAIPHAHRPPTTTRPPLLTAPTAAVKVATFLTMPSSEPLVTANRAAQEAHMGAVRDAFLARSEALAAVVGMLAEPLAKHPRMDQRDAALVQLVVAFLK